MHCITGGREKKRVSDTAKGITIPKFTAKQVSRSLQKRRKMEKQQTPKILLKVNKQQDKDARCALASGELAAENLQRRTDRDSRTLYVR